MFIQNVGSSVALGLQAEMKLIVHKISSGVGFLKATSLKLQNRLIIF